MVALLAKMHSEFGSVPFEQLTSHAIDYAENGIRFLPGERARQQSVSEKIYRNLGMREIFTDESGDIHPENHLTIQKALANTLRLISNDPHKSFYQGDIASNLATTATFLPILGALALELGLSPLVLSVPITLAASCAFMLPVATPPNAVVFSSGFITIPQMIRAGLYLNVIGLGLLMIVSQWLVPIIF